MGTPAASEDFLPPPNPALLGIGDPACHRLIAVVQQLSLARTLDAVIEIVRHAARELTGADGATFVLRDEGCCYYADEDAIAPLWKGQRFPLSACISGWSMLNSKAAVIEDIYSDPRIPADAYRPTFVKSLVMVPIRIENPIGAIGNYWATQRFPTQEEIEILQALANTTSVALENVQIYAGMESRIRERTLQLEAANRELESFSYSVSHDLRTPLRHINGFADCLEREFGTSLDGGAREYVASIRQAGGRMTELVNDLLRLAHLSRTPIKREQVHLSEMAKEIVMRLSAAEPDRDVEIRIVENLRAVGDAGLLRIALENLLSNAWKYSAATKKARIEFGMEELSEGPVLFVKDNGAGFDMKYADKLFAPFQRLHTEQEFPGSGIGLATVQKIIHRHDGRISARSERGQGVTFYFSLPQVL